MSPVILVELRLNNSCVSNLTFCVALAEFSVMRFLSKLHYTLLISLLLLVLPTLGRTQRPLERGSKAWLEYNQKMMEDMIREK